MDTEYIQSYCTLQQELDQAKNTLITLNDNIRRIVGREPKDIFRGDKNNETKRSDLEKVGSKDTSYKRRNLDSKSVFNRLSAPISRISDEELRPRLNSRVIRELPSRQEILAAQCSDAESRARNRRMFGSLLGTLQKFCLEESRLKQKEDKKAKIEKKLEEQELLERESLKKERELLFCDRKRKQLEIRKLELKMSRLKDFETWESSQKLFKGHIKTKTKPHIYFRPCILNKKTEKLLSDSRSSLKKEINKKKDAVNKEIADIENRFKIQEENNGDSIINSLTHPISNVLETIEDGQHTPDIKNELNSSTENDETLRIQIKNDADCKENNSRNVIEATLGSKVIVSNGSPKDT